jgi:hypothetical protein
MDETKQDKPLTLRKGMRVRIRTDAEKLKPHHRAKGQDTHVSVILDDGTEVALTNVRNATWWVDGRSDYVCAALVVDNVELDTEGMVTDNLTPYLQAELDATKRRMASMQEQLEFYFGKPGEAMSEECARRLMDVVKRTLGDEKLKAMVVTGTPHGE